MKRNNYFMLLALIFVFFASKSNAQHVDAGDDFYVCNGDTEVTLHPNVRSISTMKYEISSIPFEWDGDLNGTEVESMRTGTLQALRDDDYSVTIPFPIDFYFLGNPHNEVVIGSNGDIIFNTIADSQFDDYQYFDAGIMIPNEVLPFWDGVNSSDAVYGAAQDINPGVRDNPGTSTSIQYKIVGDAPYRKFIVTYNEIPSFLCDSGANLLLNSQQIVFHETTDIIDVFIKERHTCPDWNHNAAAIGVQNEDIPPCGIAAPGRNTSVWEVDPANPEGWRFTPTITSASVITWYNENRDVVANTLEPTVPFNPVNGQETYLLEVTFTDCHGDSFTEFDEVTVYQLPAVQFNLPENEMICADETKILDGTVQNADDYTSVTYSWTDANGNVLGTDPQLTITQGGEYTVTATVDGNCSVSATDVVEPYPYKCEIPQGISPNGDGLNDNWVLDYLAEKTGIANLEIFDRRGVKVYEKKNYTHEFEGKNNNGDELPAASYFYVIKLKDRRKLTGWIYLAR